MKKVLALCALCLSASSQAQDNYGVDINVAHDFTFCKKRQPIDNIKINCGVNFMDYGYVCVSLYNALEKDYYFAPGGYHIDRATRGFSVGLGVQKRLKPNKHFILNMAAYPYGGWTYRIWEYTPDSQGTPVHRHSQIFGGIRGAMSFGVRLFSNKDDKGRYLTLGYDLDLMNRAFNHFHMGCSYNLGMTFDM